MFESVYVRKDGSLLPLEVNLRLIEFNNQKFILTSARDITGRKIAEEALKESEAKFRTLAELSPNIVFINKKGRIVYANDKCETIVGYKKEELYRDEFNFLTLIVPEHRNLIKASFSKHMNGEEVIPIEYALITKDGRRIEVILSTTLIVYENDTAILGTVTDITDRKKAEEYLRESENKYRMLTEHSLTGIFIEQDEKFVYVNEKFARMHGYEPEELLGKEHWILIPPNDKEMVRDRAIKRRKGEPVSVVFQRPRIKKDGSVIWAQQIMVAIEYHGKPAVMGNIVDITEVKEATDKRVTALKSTIEAIALTSETRDPYTAGHQHRVAELACAIAREMNLPKDQIEGVRLAGVVHDIGKMYVPAEILSKPGQLSEAEFNMIKMHSKAGYDILKNIDFPWPIAKAVLQHHLRLDGSGYPACESGKEIIIEARILTVADVVEAMASHRPYRPALGINKALDEITQNRGKLYDPDVVDACLRLFNEKEFKL
jgi:PAS domain S-box-containing protein/putative nucleotidyltransferase with HDIG domain